MSAFHLKTPVASSGSQATQGNIRVGGFQPSFIGFTVTPGNEVRVTFSLSSGQLGPSSRSRTQVYIDLIHSYNNAGEYSCCFTELQRDFIISRPTKLKSLIRLVKHWYRQCTKMPKGKGPLPPQHGLELLAVYAWEQGGWDPQFNMAEGFRTVLELVTQYRQLCVYWTVNYNCEDETVGDFLKRQLQKDRPIILDPADPTGNLGQSARWDLLAKEAAACISSLCCRGRDGTPIRPWPVKAAV